MVGRVTEDFTRWSRLRDIGRWYVTRFVANAAAEVPAAARVLDAGAGECAYRSLFEHAAYLGLDLSVGEPSWNYRNLDLVARLDRLPIRSCSIDAVLCTQTLEHVTDPAACVFELARTLKPGGKLYLTVPMSQVEHQVPHDFFRFTSYGVRSLVERAGLAGAVVFPLGGTPARWAYELSLYLPPLRPGPPQHWWRSGLNPVVLLGWCLVRLAQWTLLALDRFDRKRNHPWGWAAVAVKPALTQPAEPSGPLSCLAAPGEPPLQE